MARAWVLSPEPDSPFLQFDCRRQMESWALTLSSSTLSWMKFVFRPLLPEIPEISYTGSVVWHSSDCEVDRHVIPRRRRTPRASRSSRECLLDLLLSSINHGACKRLVRAIPEGNKKLRGGLALVVSH